MVDMTGFASMFIAQIWAMWQGVGHRDGQGKYVGFEGSDSISF